MTASSQFILDVLQFRPHPRPDGVPTEQKSSLPVDPTDVCEAQEVEGLRFPSTSIVTVALSESSELDDASLVRVELQLILRESIAERCEKLFSITAMLETHYEVVGITHDDDLPSCMPLSPVMGPSVEDIVQVHICEER
jgi:hypothetical protein